MLVLAKNAAVLAISMILMGSKVVIHVPKGGSVISSSGLYACTAGETCTIDINNQHFAETFTAEAEPGFAFSRWGDGNGAVCGGSRDPYCSELDVGPFSGSDSRLDRLASGHAVRITPLFDGNDSDAQGPEPHFEISSHHRTHYYQVHGRSQEEIWAQLHGPANPLAVDRNAGTKPLGHASFHYQYNYASEFAASPGNCQVESGAFDFHFETVLPQLAEAGRANEHLQSRWQPFQALITEHEAGHHAIYRRLVTQLPQAVIELGAVPCSELEDRVRVAVESAVGAIRRASIAYDEHHGGDTYAVSSLSY